MAVDTTSHGTSTRPQPVAARAYTTYDHGARSAQVDNGRATTGTTAGVTTDLRVPSGAMVAAKTGAKACSFAGATVVLMADGTKKPIEDVEVGDKVIATDPETGEQEAKTVEHV